MFHRFMNIDALLARVARRTGPDALRKRHNRRHRQDRMMGSLRLAIVWANRESRGRAARYAS